MSAILSHTAMLGLASPQVLQDVVANSRFDNGDPRFIYNDAGNGLRAASRPRSREVTQTAGTHTDTEASSHTTGAVFPPLPPVPCSDRHCTRLATGLCDQCGYEYCDFC